MKYNRWNHVNPGLSPWDVTASDLFFRIATVGIVVVIVLWTIKVGVFG